MQNDGRFKPVDLTGKVFTNLTALKEVGRNKFGYRLWRCRCVCGKIVIKPSQVLNNGNTKSCGCLPQGRPCTTGDSTLNTFYHHAKNGARLRDIDWHLTREQAYALMRSNCHYCGSPPPHKSKPKQCKNSTKANGIDRVDSNGHYTPDNCVPCCPACNIAKSTMTTQEFKAWVRKVYYFFASH